MVLYNTCKHISQSSTFTSNVTKRSYEVVSNSASMTCISESVVYLITCNRCGIQYVGETGQKLRNRLNNHRSSLKRLPNLYLSDPVEERHKFSTAFDLCCFYPVEERHKSVKFGLMSFFHCIRLMLF